MTFSQYPCCPPRSLYTDITVKTCAINISSISVRPCSSSGISSRSILFSSENFLVSSGLVLFFLNFFSFRIATMAHFIDKHHQWDSFVTYGTKFILNTVYFGMEFLQNSTFV